MTNLPVAMRRAMWILALLAGFAVLLVAVAVLLLVDDWSRDLRENTARTDPEHPDPLLRDIETAAPPEAVVDALESFVEEHSDWRIRSREPADGTGLRLHLVRTTRLLRFQDDVIVELTAAGPTRISISSTSRIGKADFGQNPRNIRELSTWLREQLSSAVK